MKKGYWILHVDATDPENHPQYLAADAAAFEEYNEVFLVRGGENTGPHPRLLPVCRVSGGGAVTAAVFRQ